MQREGEDEEGTRLLITDEGSPALILALNYSASSCRVVAYPRAKPLTTTFDRYVREGAIDNPSSRDGFPEINFH